jgi:hypothetical protein
VTPESIITNLDAALARTGRQVMVRRWLDSGRTEADPRIEVMVRASVRPVKRDEGVGAVNQPRQKVILSPTGLEALMPLLPSDKIILGGFITSELPWDAPQWWNGVENETRQEGTPASIVVGDRVVRIELVVLG